MPRRIAPLSETRIRTVKPIEKGYKLADGYGLYMLVTPTGGKLWRFKYRIDGKERLMSLGSYPETSLAEARDIRTAARKMVEQGIDPSERKKAVKIAASGTDCLQSVALEWHKYNAPRWSDKHASRLLNRLYGEVFPYIGGLAVDAIDTPTLLQILRRIEARSLETAHRIKIAFSQIYRYAIQNGFCTYDPTHALKGALLPQKKVHTATVTDPAMVGPLLRTIDNYHGGVVVRSALRLLPLVFTRPGELRQAEWSEFNLDAGLWSIPAERMKMKQPHIVPLSKQAIAVLRDVETVSSGMKYVFPTARTGRCISDMAINTALRSMGVGGDTITGHGFRAMARTLLDEVLHFRVDYIEHQLAHAVKDPLGRAYNRTTHLDERVKMMQVWADYLDTLKKAPA